jgi:tetratricopeptide (TPR) repeat protein
VLRHEFVHVVTLQQTDFNIPHWFTEALAVRYEELERPAEWNRVLYRRWRSGQLFDLDAINLGFIRPASGSDRTLAYCQAELYAEFLLEEFGEGALSKLLKAYAANAETRQALRDAFGVEADAFEARFGTYVGQIVARSFSPEAPPPPADVLHRRLTEQPDDADAWAQLAQVHEAAGRGEQARRCAEAALKRSEGQPLASLVLARLEVDAGKRQAAIPILERSLTESPTDLRMISLLARLYLQKGELEQAARLYETGLRSHPDSELCMKSLARVYLLANNQRKLGRTLEQLAVRDYDNTLLRKKLQELAHTREDWEGMLHWATAVLHIDVRDAGAHAARALALERLGREQEAIAARETEAALKGEL